MTDVNDIDNEDISTNYVEVELLELLENTSIYNNIYYEDEIQKIDLTTINPENTILFSLEKFMDECLSTYKNSAAIYIQFEKDLPRCDIFINGVKIKSLDDFKSKIKCNLLNIELLLILLCNQSSMGYPFFLMNKLYTNETKEIFVTGMKRYSVNIEIGTKSIDVYFNTAFQIYDLKNTTRLHTIEINMLCDLMKLYAITDDSTSLTLSNTFEGTSLTSTEGTKLITNNDGGMSSALATSEGGIFSWKISC